MCKEIGKFLTLPISQKLYPDANEQRHQSISIIKVVLPERLICNLNQSLGRGKRKFPHKKRKQWGKEDNNNETRA